jgi:hypothetical protein
MVTSEIRDFLFFNFIFAPTLAISPKTHLAVSVRSPHLVLLRGLGMLPFSIKTPLPLSFFKLKLQRTRWLVPWIKV